MKSKKDQTSPGIITKTRTPDEHNQDEDQDDPSAAKEACASALLRAINAGDVKAISEALDDHFAISDKEPHEEGEHINPHSYDAQNKLAKGNE